MPEKLLAGAERESGATRTLDRGLTSILLVSAAYIAAQILSDITSLKIVHLVGFSIDAGTLIYPFTFTLRDLAHKVIGRHGARVLIFAAAGTNLFMAGLFWLVSRIPYDPSAGPQADWDAVLAPVWRIVIASILAEVASELTDTEIYHLWVTRVTERFEWARVLVSNAFSVPLDSLLFVGLAFGGVFPLAVVISIFWANVLIKGIVTLISLPGIYLVRPGGGEA
ncbi:MAG: queuosine precursor transporter [Anaerolineales bacterium]